MIDFLKEQIKTHALETPSLEVCGFVYEGNSAKAVPNISETPKDAFVIDPREYLEAKRTGKLIGYYHSHPTTGSKPSEADKAISERMQLPLYIYSIPEDVLTIYVPNGYEVPLLGRAFVLGIHDCAGLVVDYFKQKLKINIQDFSRDIAAVEKGFKDLIPFAKANGFILVDKPKEHDIIAMKLGRPTYCNHVGVMLSNGSMMHQVISRTSQVVVYGGYWQRSTAYVLRHSSL